MNSLRITRNLFWLLPALASGLAQQVVGKPVLSADPTPATVAGPAKAAGQNPSYDPAEAALQASLSPNYIIGPDDSLQVTVWGDPSQSASSLPVRPDGKISLPLINDIMAAGLTPMQLGANIREKLKQFDQDPVVYVTVLGVRGKNIYMIGEIGHVGPLAITPGMTVLQAIATAGGLGPYANKKGIYILRGDPAKPQKIHFDYNKALKKGDMQGVSLVPGDTIVVP
jgi:polysaccharide export outer membrane protein